MNYAAFERFELEMEEAHALACSQPGRDASEDVAAVLRLPYIVEDVAAVLRLPYIVAQLDAIGPDKIREELKEYGAWSDEELADDAENRARILWCAACDIREACAEMERAQ